MRIPKFSSRLASNFFFTSLTGLISKFGALLFTILIARNFYPEEFGAYSFALTIILSLLFFTDLGLGGTLTRFLSESLGNNNKSQATSRLLFLIKTKLFLSFVISVVLFFCSGLIAGFFNKPEIIPLLKIGSFYLFINSFYNLTTSIFLSIQELRNSTYVEFVFQTSRILLFIIALFFFKSVESVFWVLFLSMLISVLLAIIIILFKYPFFITSKTEPIERERLLKFSGYIALSSITVLIFGNVDKLVLGYFLDLEFIGFYAAILTIISGVLGILGFSSVFLPVFTQLKKDELKNAFKKYFNYLSILAFPATIGLAFIITPLLKVLYGFDYVPQQFEFAITLTSIILSFLVLESSFTGIYTILFNATEKPKIPAYILLFCSAINLILNFILIYYLSLIRPEYGLIGAAASTLFSRYIGLILLFFYSNSNFGIMPNRNSILKPLFASMIMLGYLFAFKSFFELDIIRGIIMIIGAIIIYFIVSFAIKSVSLKEIKRIFVIQEHK